MKQSCIRSKDLPEVLKNKELLEAEYRIKPARDIAKDNNVPYNRVRDILSGYGITAISILPELLQNKELLEADYKIKSASQIATELDIARDIVIAALKRLGIKRNSHSEELCKSSTLPSILNSKELLEEAYHQKTTTQIGIDLDVAASTVCLALSKMGIVKDKWNTNVSGLENEISEYVVSLGFDVIRNSRKIIAPLEIDIYVPEKKVAIELDGLYWHSIRNVQDNVRSKIDQHKNKASRCNEVGIELLSILDTEWNMNKDLWKSMIAQKLGKCERIHARKCDYRQISASDGNKFISENHMQGPVNGGNYFALFYQENIVSVLQIGKSRYNKKYDWEILRFCSRKGVSIIGGFSKLLKHSGISGAVLSYANRRWSSGKMYERCGFALVDETPPNYWYWKKHNILENRMKYQKHKLPSLLPVFDSNITEFENMINNGYSKYCDSGNLTYRMVI